MLSNRFNDRNFLYFIMEDEQLENFYREVLRLFPNININHFKAGSQTNNEIRWANHHFSIPAENSNLYKSSYFHDGGSVVHFTNLYALNSILSEGLIRLYNLHKLNDPREFTYASKVFNLTQSKKSDAKENFYLISFCDSRLLNEVTSEFNMWRLYGDNGKGVAVKFSIDNDPLHWRDFHMSDVKYGHDNRNLFAQLSKLSQEISNSKFSVDVDLSKLCIFHKSNLYKVEREIRLIYDRREMRAGLKNRTIKYFDQLVFPKLRYDLFKIAESNDKTRYLEIPIRHVLYQEYEPELPLLKIEEIIVGYNFIKKPNKLLDRIKEMCVERLGYEPKVGQTRLHKFYWDKEK